MEPIATLLAQADAETTAQLVERLGFPIAIAVVCLCAILAAMGGFFGALGYTLYRIGNWLAPIVQKGAESHFDLVETIKESSRQTAESSQQTATSISAMVETQKAIQREMTEQRKLNEKVCDHMAAPNPMVAIQTEKVEVQK